MGIIFALAALLFWGIGDFLIQRSTRRFGDWIALFFISLLGTVFIFPFIYHDLSNFDIKSTVLWTASIIIFLAALLDFEALKIGKISVIEPIYAFEVMITVFL